MKLAKQTKCKENWILSLLLISCFCMAACEKDWLDAKPSQDLAVPTTLKDFQALLDNTQTATLGDMTGNCPALGEIATGEYYITDASFPSRLEIERYAYTWSDDLASQRSAEWDYTYSKVLVCNVILEGLEKLKNLSAADQLTWNNIKGQTLFQRSKAFYEISQVWADPFQPTTAASKLGIPLRLESDIAIPITRSTLQQTYDRILNDLKEAEQLLPVFPKNKSRASKTAVCALLGRIYLSMEDYTNAGVYANKCLQQYSSLLDYNQLNISSTVPFILFNDEVIYHSRLYNYAMIGTQSRIAESFKGLYVMGDLRNTRFFATSAGLITFKGSYSGARVNFCGLATDEQYLIRAECFAREGKTSEAMTNLNFLLKTRLDNTVTYPSLVAVDAEDALRKILLERRKQLLFRGLRWSDLRRLNRDPRFAETLSRTILGQTYTLAPESYKYTFPIPNIIIQETGILQNAGWD